MNSFLKVIFNFLAILVIGGLGGVLAERLVVPYLVNNFGLNKIEWLKQVKNNATVVNKVERVVINESTAIEDAAERVGAAMVGIVTKKSIGSAGKMRLEQVVAEGSGFILTSDGVIVTANNLVPSFKAPEQAVYYIVKDDKLISAQVVKRDVANNLVLLKIQESNLSSASLSDAGEMRLGQRLIWLGVELNKNNVLTKFMNVGVIRSLGDEGAITTLGKERETMNGGAVIDLKGEVVGLSLIDYTGQVKIVLIGKIKELLK